MSLTQHYTGSKYDRSLDIKDIAKLVRAEIKADVKAGTIPGYKYSVRIERYSMGRAMHIIVTAPKGSYGEYRTGEYWERREAAGSKLIKHLEGIAAQFNFDKGDVMQDLFFVNFYTQVYLEESKVLVSA